VFVPPADPSRSTVFFISFWAWAGRIDSKTLELLDADCVERKEIFCSRIVLSIDLAGLIGVSP